MVFCGFRFGYITLTGSEQCSACKTMTGAVTMSNVTCYRAESSSLFALFISVRASISNLMLIMSSELFVVQFLLFL